jgi:uncharacterized protein (TIGR03580 family)
VRCQVASLLIKAVIVGGLAGFAFAAGAARMFHAPEYQAMGAFRTLGEMNACRGDPVTHLSFGSSFIAVTAVTAVASGGVGQDIWHRIVPNVSAGLLLLKDKDPDKTFKNPEAMAPLGAVIGAASMLFFMSMASVVPARMAEVAQNIMVPAADAMMDYLMPVIFMLSAIDGGVHTGVSAILYGGVAQMVMGNAVPGCVMGILVGKAVEVDGWKRSTIILFSVVTGLFVVVAYFCGFFDTLAKLFVAG